MRKIIKNNILGFILGGIIFGSVGIYAASYYAKDVLYQPNDASWDVSNVNDAINSLYSMKTELDNIKSLGDATAADITSGKTAVVQGKLITGTAKDSNEYKKIVLLGTYTNSNGGAYAGISSTSQTINVSTYDNYATFTENNFIVEAISGAATAWVNDGDHDISLPYTIGKSYNASTGILTVSNTSASWDGSWRKTTGGLTKYNVYLVY